MREARELARANRWLGGRRVLRSVLREVVGCGERFSLLDVGAASGDIGRSLGRRFPHATICSVDRRPELLDGADSPRVAADAFHLPFGAGSFDFVLCSLFLHHFTDEHVARLLEAFQRLARRAVVIVDLHRLRYAFYFFPVTQRLLAWHPATVYDACLSVQAGFAPRELAALIRAAGGGAVRVRRHWPWGRLSAVIRAA